MRGSWQSALSLTLGFLGGLLATEVHGRLHSREITTVLSAGTIRARRFELVGPSDMPLAYDGRPIRYNPFSALIASDGRIRIQQRLDNSQKPVLVMGDSKTEARLLLGHRVSEDVVSDSADPWDRWGLSFRDISEGWIDFADIGITTPMDTKKRTGYLVLRDSSARKFSAVLK